jgi:transposase-like protein
LRLPRYPADTLHVSDAVSVVQRDGTVWYFHQGMPMGSHAADDHESFRMQTSMLCDSGACRLVEVERAFRVSAISVKRALKQYRAGGAKSFFVKVHSVRADPVMTPARLVEIQALIDAGLSDRQIAERLGLKQDTIYRTVKDGRLHRAVKKGARLI